MNERHTITPLRARHEPSDGAGAVRVSDVLDRLVETIDLAPVDVLSTIHMNWSDIVGAEMARHCRPGAISDGQLVVSASDAATASELQWRAATVLDRIVELTGNQQIQSLRVRVEPHQ